MDNDAIWQLIGMVILIGGTASNFILRSPSIWSRMVFILNGWFLLPYAVANHKAISAFVIVFCISIGFVGLFLSFEKKGRK